MKKIFVLLLMTQVFMHTLPAQFESMRLDGSSAFLSFYDGATPKGLLWNNNGNMTLGTFIQNPTGQIKFVTNNAERMVIAGDGNVGIGITAPDIAARLHVENQGVAILGISTNSIGVRGFSQNSEAIAGTSINNTGIYGISFFSTGVIGDGNIGVIGRGDLYNFDAQGPGIPYHSTSSLRWKENIRNIPNPLEKLAALRGVYFNWDEEHGGHHDVGFIAEEVGKVLPEIVGYEENGVDATGMDYSKMTPLLVEAVNAIVKDYTSQIEKHSTIIERQNESINELSQELKAMKAQIANLSE